MELFRCSWETPGDHIEYLGELTSYDIKTVLPDEDYTELTVDNFIVMPKDNLNTPSHKTGSYVRFCSGMDFGVDVSSTSTYNYNKVYDPKTGMLTCSISTTAGNPGIKVYFYKEK